MNSNRNTDYNILQYDDYLFYNYICYILLSLFYNYNIDYNPL